MEARTGKLMIFPDSAVNLPCKKIVGSQKVFLLLTSVISGDSDFCLISLHREVTQTRFIYVWSYSVRQPSLDQPSTSSRPTLHQLSTNSRPNLNQFTTNSQPTPDQLSTKFQPVLDQVQALRRADTHARRLLKKTEYKQHAVINWTHFTASLSLMIAAAKKSLKYTRKRRLQ